MTPSKKFLSALVIFVIASLGVTAAPLRIRSDRWMPFNGAPGTDAQPGYVLELLQEVFGSDALDYQNLAWDASLGACRGGQIDAVIGANEKESQGLVHGEESISEVKFAVFLKKATHFSFQSLASFKGHKLGAVAGYSYWVNMDDMIRANPADIVFLDQNNAAEDGIGRLLRGDIEFYVEAVPVFFWTAKKAGVDTNQFRMVAIQSGDPSFVSFHADENGRRRALQLDEGIRRLRANGKLRAILDKYGLTDWK